MDNNNMSRHAFMPTDDIPFSFLNEEAYIQLLSIWRRIRRHPMIFTRQDMEDELLRFVTFLHFPRQTGQDIRVLAIAGFYYYGEGDSVVCYCCGLWIRSWSQNDEPWYIHRTYSATCTFIQNNRVVNRPYYGITEGGFRHLEDVIQLLPRDTIGPLPVRSVYEIQTNVMFTTEQSYQSLEHIERSRLLPSAALPMRNGEVQHPYFVNGASHLQDNSSENFDIEARIVSIRNYSRASASYFNIDRISERNIPLRINWSEDDVSDSMLNENVAPQSDIMSAVTENHSENHICTMLSTERGMPNDISNFVNVSVPLHSSSNSDNMSKQLYVCEGACDETARKQLTDVNQTTNGFPRTFVRSMSTPLPAESVHQSPNHMPATRVERPVECQNTAKVNIVACGSQSGQGSPSYNADYTAEDVENDITTPRHISNLIRLEETDTEERNNYLSLSDRNDSTNSNDDNKSQEHAGMSEEIFSNRLIKARTNYKGNGANIIGSNEETTIAPHRNLQDTSHISCSVNDENAEVTVPVMNNHKTQYSSPDIIGLQGNAIESSVDTLSPANTTPDVEACDAQSGSNAIRDVDAEKPLRHVYENERETDEELNATAESMTVALATESKLSSDVNTSAVHTANARVVSLEKRIPVKEPETSQNRRNKHAKVTSKPDENCSNDHGEAPRGAVDVLKTVKVENKSTVHGNTSLSADTFTDDINKGKFIIDSIDLQVRKQTESAQEELQLVDNTSTSIIEIEHSFPKSDHLGAKPKTKKQCDILTSSEVTAKTGCRSIRLGIAQDLRSKQIPHDYSRYEARMRSYRNNPTSKSERLAGGGFYYTGVADHIRCFSCHREFESPQLERNLWVIHAKESPKCEYLLMRKGQDFIETVKQGNEVLLRQYSNIFDNERSSEFQKKKVINTEEMYDKSRAATCQEHLGVEFITRL